MLPEFADFAGQLFAGVDPATVRELTEKLRHANYTPPAFYETDPLPQVSQGDVLGEIPFRSLNEMGSWMEMRAPALVLSNTCDIEQDTHTVLARGLPLHVIVDEGGVDAGALTNNAIYHLFSLPDIPDLGSHVFDLSALQTVNSDWLRNEIEEGGLCRHASLSQLGYWLCVCKLTVHFLRPETAEVVRTDNPCPQH